ncbi:hypothetical protein LSTR_LSTR005051 [Laodelphax striatellus]|uniref:Uncharacterized protein n=1 Tax=Laodelphax striatellus TaxID=195883 RepID=A0A482WTE8_LAOST|nr:hypothetical protein LSTR_LSTR005051 [Laodelphax striatellus]
MTEITFLEKLIAFLQFLVIYKIAAFVLSRIYVHFFKKPIDVTKAGSWAVITGCTDGIGKSFAFELAKKGMNVVLISRSQEKLEDLAKELTSRYQIKTKIIVVDFVNIRDSQPEIEQHLASLDIGLLVNNVGVSIGIGYFLEYNWKEINDMIEVNSKSVIGMTAIILPKMVAKRKGVIINVSSIASRVPTLYMSAYAATKAFVTKFSEDLMLEYEDYGITVQCLTPAFVATKMISGSPTVTSPSADTYVRSALKQVGLQLVTTGYLPHDFEIYFVRFTDAICPKLTAWILKRFVFIFAYTYNNEEHKNYMKLKF